MNNSLYSGVTGAAAYFLYGGGMVVIGDDVEVPFIMFAQHAAAPVFQPYVISGGCQGVKDVDGIRGVENIAFYSGAMHEHYRAAGGLSVGYQAPKVAFETIERIKWEYFETVHFFTLST